MKEQMENSVTLVILYLLGAYLGFSGQEYHTQIFNDS